jgi:predicted double-glycine peptidase
LIWIFVLELGVVALESAAFLIIGFLLCRKYLWARYPAIVLGAVCLSYRVLSSTFPDRFYISSPYLILTGLITPAGFLLLAAAFTVTTKRPRQRILVGVFSVVLTYYVFCDATYLAVAGTDLAKLTGQWQGQTMRQSRSFTCGPAAAAALLRAWNIDVTEGDVAFAARTSYRGTELPRLTDAIGEFGKLKPLNAEIMSADFEKLILMNRPAILLVHKGRRRHAVVLLRADRGRLHIADPGAGTQEMHISSFGDHYEWNGRAIVAWRDSDFERRSNEPPDPALHD